MIMFVIFVRDYYMASYLISKATKIGFLFLFQIVLCSLFSQAIPVIFTLLCKLLREKNNSPTQGHCTRRTATHSACSKLFSPVQRSSCLHGLPNTITPCQMFFFLFFPFSLDSDVSKLPVMYNVFFLFINYFVKISLHCVCIHF